MKYTVEFSAEDFPAWGQAREILDRILREGKGEEFERYLEEIFPEEMPRDVTINDILAFEWETIYEYLGISDEDEDDTDKQVCERWCNND